MLDLKKLLVTWGFNKPEIQFDEEATHMDIGSVRILDLTIDGAIPKCDWKGAWKDWVDLHSSPELKELLHKATAAMKAAGKGQGKSKYAPARG